MKIEELLKYMPSDTDRLKIVGTNKCGLTDLYKGDTGTLKKILKVFTIIHDKNWGEIDENKCFLIRDINTISSDNNCLYITINMPDSYLHENKEGIRLDEFINL